MSHQSKKVKLSFDERTKGFFDLLPAIAHHSEEFGSRTGKKGPTKKEKDHENYYKYEDTSIFDLALECLFEDEKNHEHKKKEHELLPFLLSLIEIQKTRMKPELFKTLEGQCYQWKYEEILNEAHVEKSSHSSDSHSDSESSSDSSSSKRRSNRKTDKSTDKKHDNGESNNNDKKHKAKEIITEEKDGVKEESKNDSGKKDGEEEIKGTNFVKSFGELNNSRIFLELKKESEFVPWIYFKTVEKEGKKTIGMFAGRDFPSRSGIGFYISHPWLKWPEPFTKTPPEDYVLRLQNAELLPVKEADACMWFYDDGGFVTACDPIRKPPTGKQEDVLPSKRILGMGFHLVNLAEDLADANVEVDSNGCVKTMKSIKVGTELVMQKQVQVIR